MSLELTMGGRMMGGEAAVTFFESVAELIPEEDRTEEFCDDYTFAMNRLRYLVRQSLPTPVIIRNGASFTEYLLCGKCGASVQAHHVHCWKCGGKIGW